MRPDEKRATCLTARPARVPTRAARVARAAVPCTSTETTCSGAEATMASKMKVTDGSSIAVAIRSSQKRTEHLYERSHVELVAEEREDGAGGLDDLVQPLPRDELEPVEVVVDDHDGHLLVEAVERAALGVHELDGEVLVALNLVVVDDEDLDVLGLVAAAEEQVATLRLVVKARVGGSVLSGEKEHGRVEPSLEALHREPHRPRRLRDVALPVGEAEYAALSRVGERRRSEGAAEGLLALARVVRLAHLARKQLLARKLQVNQKARKLEARAVDVLELDDAVARAERPERQRLPRDEL
eukprot:1048607-Pleurochrysis_carterae.AAC.1